MTARNVDESRPIIAIDPGSTESAYIWLREGKPEHPAKVPNEHLLTGLRNTAKIVTDEIELVIEDIQHYGRGMAVGAEVFETCIWIGRFIQVWVPRPYRRIRRPTVKAHVCGSVTANDAQVRQALIDLYGGTERAIGSLRCPACKGKGWRGVGRPECVACGGGGWKHPPGILHGIAKDVWSALALAVTASAAMIPASGPQDPADATRPAGTD